MVLEKARLMARLVDEVTELARLGSERIAVQRVPGDLGDVVERVVADYSTTVESHTVDLTVEPGLPIVLLDRDRIAQVLTNLLSNGVKFWPAGGTLKVRVSADPDGVRVDVADRGPGIPPDEAEKVFEPFYRIESDRTRGVPGTGVGLSVSRGIVEAHGGRIWVEPNPGGGALFRFTVPTSTDAEPDQDARVG
jgi:signal transduction histidine kinase